MKTSIRFRLAAVGAVAALVASPLFANHPPVNPSFGTAVHDAYADRQITIDASTKWVNVTDGETIKFIVKTPSGKQESFSWRFDTLNMPMVELNKVAPAGVLGTQSVKVYIAPNPLWAGGE